jgi:hypothetical protein
MNPFEFVIAIIVLSFIYKLLDVWMRQKAGRRSDETASQMLQRLGDVEERVRVLERIVTDERFDLKQQFKDLASK